MSEGPAPHAPSDGLPPGRMVAPNGLFTGGSWKGPPALWVSDRPVPEAAATWIRLYEHRADTGLYPLLLDTLNRYPDRPWHAGELKPVPVETIDALDAETVLRSMWERVIPVEEEDEDPAGLPYVGWPGLAPSGRPAAGAPGPADAARPGAGATGPDRAADAAAATIAGHCAGGRLLGLVRAARGADALALSGWTGPCNHTNHTEDLSAVVRSWEDRFGVRVVGVGFDTLDLSVAAPPATIEQALRIAAEHHGFCPDNIWQGPQFEEYAEMLIGADRWSFWWD